MRWRWWPTICALLLLLAAGCGDGGGSAGAAVHGPARGYLLQIDQLVSPDFRTDQPPHTLSAADAAAAAGVDVATVQRAGMQTAAAEGFLREGADLAVSNGPVQVLDTVMEFSTIPGATQTYATARTALDTQHGAVAVSTGALGDEAHADTRTATTAAGLTAAEITVLWRVANVVNVLVVRGRNGGIHPDDALLLAHRQTSVELGLGPSTPLPTVMG